MQADLELPSDSPGVVGSVTLLVFLAALWLDLLLQKRPRDNFHLTEVNSISVLLRNLQVPEEPGNSFVTGSLYVCKCIRMHSASCS